MTINFQSTKNAPLRKTLGFCLFPGLLKAELLFRKIKEEKVMFELQEGLVCLGLGRAWVCL